MIANAICDHFLFTLLFEKMVGPTGFEPATPSTPIRWGTRAQSRRSACAGFVI